MTVAENMAEWVVGAIFVIVLAVIFFLAAVSDHEASFTDRLYYTASPARRLRIRDGERREPP